MDDAPFRDEHALLVAQGRILEMVATGVPAADSLAELIRFVEVQEDGLRCGILTISEDGTHFRCGSGPDLPDRYHRALDGVPITTPYFAPCSEAAHRRIPVIVPDIARDPRWSDDWRELALSCGFASCRSAPVLAPDDERVLASLVMYYDHACDPGSHLPRLIDIATHLAAIALQRERSEVERRRATALSECQRHALQMLAEGAALDEVLEFLIRATERNAAGGMLGAILLLNDASTHFERSVGPSLPPAFNDAVPGIAVSSGLGVCCHAVSRREPVVVPDFSADPEWSRFADFLAPFGLHAGWSTPIIGPDGRVLGTFANYYRHPCNPVPTDLDWAETTVRTAAIAIERARAESALRESRENLTAAMAASDSGTFRWDPPTGKFLEFDANLKRLFGFAADDEVRSTEDFLGHVHPDGVAKLLPAVEACRKGADFSMEYRVVLPDGDVRWLYDRAKMGRDAEGRPTYLVGACIDISKRKQAEEHVLESEEQFRTLADAMPQLAWMANPDGSIFWYNRGWYDYTGTTLAEMQGWGWQSVHEPDVLPSVLERWRASVATGTPFEMVFPLRGGDGVFRPFLTRAVPVRGAYGRIFRWFGTNTDITGQREIQDTLRRLTELLEHELEERSRALEAEMAERRKIEAMLQQAQHLESIGQVTGGVAHDFNNLLTVVLGQSESIGRHATDPRISRMAETIRHAAERGARLTSQLLAFSRRQALRPEIVAIDKLLPNIDDLLRRAVGETIEVKFSAPAGLWPVLIDPAQFEAVVLNLAINARDAMPQGGRLLIAARNAKIAENEARRMDLHPGEYVVLSVSDTGTGMAPEIRDRAFEPFFTTKDVGKGTGLGLSQTYGFARQSGGTAIIESSVGSGTIVSLYLPRTTARVRPNKTGVRTSVPPAGKGRTVLVAEDEAEVREVMRSTLEELGYSVIAASDGVEARAVLESGRPIDLLLTDVVMPNGVSGIDLARLATRTHAAIRVVLVSGYSHQKARDGDASGEFVLLEKPFSRARLVDTVASVLCGANTCGHSLSPSL